MRHRNEGRKLSRNTSHRRALLRNLVTSLLEHGRVDDDASQSERSSSSCGKDDHSRQAGQPARTTQVHSYLLRMRRRRRCSTRSHRNSLTARAGTAESSSSETAKETARISRSLNCLEANLKPRRPSARQRRRRRTQRNQRQRRKKSNFGGAKNIAEGILGKKADGVVRHISDHPVCACWFKRPGEHAVASFIPCSNESKL